LRTQGEGQTSPAGSYLLTKPKLQLGCQLVNAFASFACVHGVQPCKRSRQPDKFFTFRGGCQPEHGAYCLTSFSAHFKSIKASSLVQHLCIGVHHSFGSSVLCIYVNKREIDAQVEAAELHQPRFHDQGLSLLFVPLAIVNNTSSLCCKVIVLQNSRSSLEYWIQYCASASSLFPSQNKISLQSWNRIGLKSHLGCQTFVDDYIIQREKSYLRTQNTSPTTITLQQCASLLHWSSI